MKPTDIWTNHPDPQFLPICGKATTGLCTGKHLSWRNTGGQANMIKEYDKLNIDIISPMYSRAIIRGFMPDKLINHIVEICEKGRK